MSIDLLLENIRNPALLFFVLGIVAVCLRSDLEIPANSSKFISIYLLFSIGFRGGQELAHETFGSAIVFSILFALTLSILIPMVAFFILRMRMGVVNSGAIAASYGSVSAVTFVTAAAYLEANQESLNGHMVAIMALMEAPAIIAGLMLISTFSSEKANVSKRWVLKHSLSNGSVLLILGSVLIGLLANEKQAAGIAPFTNDLFKGFLAIFLLDMGITSGRKIKSLFSFGWFPFGFATVLPLINGILVAYISRYVTDAVSDQFIFAVLAASASYIAVPAAMKITVPEANEGLYLPMALAVTFPINIIIGIPVYYWVVHA